MSAHSTGRMVLIIVALVWYAVCLAISYSSSNDFMDIFGIFKNSTGSISDKFVLTVTPAGWTFALIWAVIFTYQLVWFIYALTTICRKDNEGQYLYTLSFMPPVFYVVFMMNNVVLITWLILWDRQYIEWALLVIIFAPLTLYVCLFLSFRGLNNNIETLQKSRAGKEIWLVRFLVQNGLAFFATWVSIATLLNFSIVLTYTWSQDIQLASTVVLGLLSGDILVWFTLDTFVFDKFTRYTVTPYIVVVLALSGSIDKNFDLDTNNRNSIFSVVLLAVASVLLLTKSVLLIVRHRKYPIKGNSSDDVKGTLA